MHDNRTCKIFKWRAEPSLKHSSLQPEISIPDRTFEQRISEADHQRRRGALRYKASALGDASRNNCRHGRCKRREKEEPDKLIALVAADGLGTGIKRN